MLVSNIKRRSFACWPILLYTVCTLVFFVANPIAYEAKAVGLHPDFFLPVDSRNNESSIFSIPEILVGLVPAVLIHQGVEYYRLERWEHVWGNMGFAAGYVRKEPDGRYRMCACTKVSKILSDDLMSEINIKRVENAAKITDYDDLDLDIKIENACNNAGTYSGCVDINTVTPGAPVFPNIFYRESRMRALPMEFFKQSYFDPGLRMVKENNNASGSQAAKEFVDLYSGSYEGFGSGPRGNTRFMCTEMTSSLGDIITTGQLAFSCNQPRSGDLITGHAVVRYKDDICILYRHHGALAKDCVPFPEISQPVISESRAGINIKFPDCRVRDGKQSKYCDFTMVPGQVDDDFGFSVVTPKLNMDTYDLEHTTQCLDLQGKVLPGVTADNPSCKNVKNSYVQDPSSHVKCFVTPNDKGKKFYVKRGYRYHWLGELPKVLVASSYDPKTRKYAQCDDSKSMDISSMRQADLDKISIRGRTYYFEDPVSNQKKDGGILCQDNMSYQYSSDRVFAHNGLCSSVDSYGLTSGYCKTRYDSIDNFEHFFFLESESPRSNYVSPLNPMLQGMCISNFPVHEYKYVEKAVTSSKPEKYSEYTMEISADNTKCDLLKVELWGGGEAGSLSGNGKPGKQGEYVMGILKLKLAQKDKKYLTVKVGRGGIVNADNDAAGTNTEVSLCADASVSNCGIHLVAKGGSSKDKVEEPITGLGDLIHYRVSEGRSSLQGKGKVLIPYQDHNMAQGTASEDEVGCKRDKTDKSTAIKVAPISTYYGAGGCARSDLKIVQGGAHGMVKVTCEKWSGDKGIVKKWETVIECDKATMAALKELQEYVKAKSLSENTKNFFSNMAKQEACASLSSFPMFSKELVELSVFIKKTPQKFNSEQSLSAWAKEKLRLLDTALTSEPNVSHLYSKISKTGLGGAVNPTDARAKIYSSFMEVLRSRASVTQKPKAVPVRSELDKVLERLSAFSGKHNFDVKHVFDTLRHKEIHSFYKDHGIVVNFFKVIDEYTNNIGKPGYLVDSVEEAHRAIEENVNIFRRVIKMRRETLALYSKLYPKLAYRRTNSHGGGYEVIDIVAEHFRELMGKLVTVADSRKSQDFLEVLKRIAKQAEDNKISSKDAFVKIANKKFSDGVVIFPEFVDEIVAVEQDISAGKIFYVVRTTNDFSDKDFKATQDKANAWIQQKIGAFKQILDQHPEIVREYVQARYPGVSAVKSTNKEEFVKAYGELLTSRTFVVDNEMKAIINEFLQYAKDIPLSDSSIAVFQELLNPRMLERFSSNIRLHRLIRYVRDVKHEGKGFNTADKNAPEAQMFWSVMRAMEGREGEILLGYADKAKQAALKNAFSEFVDSIAVTKIKKQIDGTRVLQEFDSALSMMTQRGKKYDPLLRLFGDEGSRITMKRSSCFSVGLYNFALALQTIINHSKRQYFPGFIVKNVKDSILYDMRECIKRNVTLLEDALSERITKKRGEAGMLEFVDDVMGNAIEQALNIRTQPLTDKELRAQMEKVLEFLYRNKSQELRVVAVAGDEIFLRTANLQWQGAIEALANIAEGSREYFSDATTRGTYVGEILNGIEDAFKSNEEHGKTLRVLYALQEVRPELLVYPRDKDFGTEGRIKQRELHLKAYTHISSHLVRQSEGNAPSPLKGPIARFLNQQYVVDNKTRSITEEQLLRVVNRMLAYSVKHKLQIDHAASIMKGPDFLRNAKGTAFAQFMFNELLPFLEKENVDIRKRKMDAENLMESMKAALRRKENLLWLRNYAWFYGEDAPLTEVDDIGDAGQFALGLAEDNIPFGPTMALYRMFRVLLTP